MFFSTQSELTDYYPFGEIRLDQKAGAFNEPKKYAGTDFDPDTGLNYMQARYYHGHIGRFVSEDPAFLAVGNENQIKQITGQGLQQYLSDPQNLNSYTYAANNPVIKYDRSGQFAFLVPAAVYIVNTAPVWVPAAITGISAAGAAVATWHWGQEVGYLSAGDHQSADRSANSVENSLTATFIGTSGFVGAGEMILGSNKSKQAASNEERLSNSSIRISSQRLLHVLDGHTLEGAENQGNSIFNAGESIEGLIQNGARHSVEKQSFGNNFQRVFDVGRNIGIERNTNQQTSVMTVITNKSGDLITSFPGRP